MKDHIPSAAKGVYNSPHSEVLLVEPRSVILGSDGSTQNYLDQLIWGLPDND